MDLLWDGIKEAFNLWIRGDAEIIEITLRTLAVSSLATAVSLVLGVRSARRSRSNASQGAVRSSPS